jgi:hypothetical protein
MLIMNNWKRLLRSGWSKWFVRGGAYVGFACLVLMYMLTFCHTPFQGSDGLFQSTWMELSKFPALGRFWGGASDPSNLTHKTLEQLDLLLRADWFVKHLGTFVICPAVAAGIGFYTYEMLGQHVCQFLEKLHDSDKQN